MTAAFAEIAVALAYYRQTMERVAFLCFAASAFFAGFSLPLGRLLLAVSVVLFLVDCVRRHAGVTLAPSGWLYLVFLSWAVGVTVFGINPHCGVPRLTKLLWFAGILAGSWMVTTPNRLAMVLGAYAAGTAVVAARTLVTAPWQAWQALHNGLQPDFMTALVNAGSMTNSQRCMVGLILAVGLVMTVWRSGGRPVWWWLVVLLTGLALLLSFKRGAWFATVSMLAVLLAVRGGWKAWLGMAVALVVLLSLAPVQNRLQALAHEFDTGSGGRITMWTKVAPALVRAHPWSGAGYRSLTNGDFRRIAPEIEPDRDHLHSNLVEMVVSTGWIGLAIYLAWMGMALIEAGGLVWRTRASACADNTLAVVLLLGLCALLLNGLVEYNFGDSELVLAYGVLMGCAAGLRKKSDSLS